MGDQSDVPATFDEIEQTKPESGSLPALIRDAGAAARFAFEEFFFGQIRNPFTRKAYLHAVRQFSEWCGSRNLELAQVTPADIGRYLDALPVALPTRKLQLAALRRFFDGLVLRHVIILNPALSVRSERYEVVEGKTPEITVEHARRLLKCLDVSHDVGRRDFAVIGILIYTAARVGAVAKLRLRDFYDVGDQFCLRFHEKGGKVREIPVRHDLQLALNEYLDQSGLRSADPASPLFRTANRRTKKLTANSMSADDMARMIKRRLREAGLSSRLSPHSFRVTTITDLLEQGVPLEDVQYLAGHADPRTTRLYDRRKRRVTRNIVERISV
ncbi:MAG: tyrosine-type recombinase/integrase [Planctomycetes bacterium]|jgi:site-specific recombinase XerD|nr:tyrosine-type recombinase/integrase [Planctomycetota bacterium]